jgi:hypothetical protein
MDAMVKLRRLGIGTILFILLFVARSAGVSAAQEFVIDLAHPPANAPQEAVLFPFDNYAIPLRKGLQMDLIASQETRRKYNPVLIRGKAGAPDSFRIGYYGTVIEINGRFHMWYIGDGDQDKVDQDKSTPYCHILYAVSDDGRHWEKPSLGLVEYNGSKENNLVQMNMEGMIYRSCTVLYEPHDPDPERRYKIFFEGKDNNGHVAFSRDGLVWHPSAHNPVTGDTVEQSGLVARDGMYYVIGQVLGSVGFKHRTLNALLSPDFEHWTDADALGFRRDAVPPRPFNEKINVGPQVHLGAGMWDRGNVLIGLYGQWNGDAQDDDRRYMKMNLGLLITHDGLHYTEPISDFKMISSKEENWMLDALGSPPRITQGQGFINHGDKTMTYYGHWGKDGNKEIRVALWDRDRLGQYAPNRHPTEGQVVTDYSSGRTSPQMQLPYFMTCPIVLPPIGAQVFLNCANLSPASELRIGLVDRTFKPIAGYGLEDCQPVQTSGYRLPVRWKGGERIEHVDGPIRLRVQWGGERFEDPIMFAVYVTP